MKLKYHTNNITQLHLFKHNCKVSTYDIPSTSYDVETTFIHIKNKLKTMCEWKALINAIIKCHFEILNTVYFENAS